MKTVALFDLIHGMHQLACDGSWQQLLDSLAVAFDTRTVALVPDFRDMGSGALTGTHLATGIPEGRAAPSSPIIRRLWKSPRNEVSVVQRFDDPSWPEMNQYYLKYFPDGQYYRSMQVLIDRGRSASTLFFVSRSASDPVFGQSEIDTLHGIIPHISTIASVYERYSRERDLEGELGYAVFYIDHARRLIDCNALALRMLGARDVVDLVDGHLQLGDASRLLRTALTSQGEAPEPAMRTSSMLVTGTSGLIYLATVSAPAGSAFPGRGVAKLTIEDTTSFAQSDRTELHRQFRLTKTEAKVASSFLQHRELAGVCRALDIRPETVRAHMKSIYAKTGCRNQADLVYFLVRYPPPFVVH